MRDLPFSVDQSPIHLSGIAFSGRARSWAHVLVLKNHTLTRDISNGYLLFMR